MASRAGRWSLEAIPTGDFALDGGAMFGVVPKNLWSRHHEADEENRIDMTMRALLLRGEVEGTERIVLIDVGAGEKLTPKLRAIHRIDYSQHDLLGSLAAAGVSPGQVTDVILTHLHFDHAGGATLSETEPTFPRATYHVQRRQWEWANEPSEKDRASYFPENFLPLQKSGQLNLVDGEIELLPEVQLVVVDGHTPGQQLPLIRTMKQSILFCADLFPTRSHIALPWIMAYDLEPLKSLEEKKRVLPLAADEGWVFFFEHDTANECCTVQETERGYAPTEPLELTDCI